MANPKPRTDQLAPPREAALKHGFYGAPQAFMACDRCPLKDTCPDCEEGGTCPHEKAYLDQRTTEVLSLPHIDPVVDRPALAILLWQEIRILRAFRYLAAAGEMLPGVQEGYAESCPLAKDLQPILNSWARLSKDLGLTPLERKRLSDSGEDVLTRAARMFEQAAELERGGDSES